MGGRWRTTAISSRRSTCWVAPTAPTIPTGAFSRRKEPCSINSADVEEARQVYASALKIAPDEPSVLSNLGLSYVLSKDLPEAEETLRRAHARAGTDPRVRANLALTVGLQGRLAEAEKIVKADLPAEEAAANVTQLKRMLSRKDKENARAEVGKMPIAASGRVE